MKLIYLVNTLIKISFIVLLYSASCLAAQPEIYILDNGMEVVLIENHASPVIASSIIVKTGLRDERPGIIGASHFLEHLLFNGTTKRTQEELYQEMDMLGGYNNAHTGENFTNFVILVNKEDFEKGLEIQTDMLFNSTLPNDKFLKEKGIVIEEIRRAHDKSSYLADIHFYQRFFKGTPYAYQVLGSRRSIEQMERCDIFEYYKSRYVPNNMTAIITGDFNPQDIKVVIDKHLGAPKPAPLPEREYLVIQLPLEPDIAPISYHQEKTGSIHLRVGLPAPSRMGYDYFTAEILTDLLEKRLNQTLAGGDNPLVQSFSLEYFSDIDFGAFILRAQLNQQENIDIVIETFRKAFDHIAGSNIKPEDILNIVTAEKAQSLFYSERPHFFAMMKSYQLAFHGYEFAEQYYNNLAQVTSQEVKNLAGELYSMAPFIPVVVLPYPQEEAAADSIVDISPVYRDTLDNGLEIIIAPGSGSGVFAVHFLFKNRSLNEPDGKSGITNFLHNMLLKGTVGYTESEFQEAMERMGMNVEISDNPWIPYDNYRTTPEFSFVRLEAINDFWEPALELCAEMILEPALSPGSMEAVRGMLIGAAARERESASALGESFFLKKLLGDNALAMNTGGDMRSLPNINHQDLVEYHQKYFAPDNMIISVVGDIPPEKVSQKLSGLFASMKPSGISVPENPAPVSQSGEYRQELGKKQSYIYLGYLIENIPQEDKAPLTVANAILSEKLQFQLREKQGLAYSLGSSVSLHDEWGHFIVSMGTGGENIETALEGIKDQIELAAKGKFSDDDIIRAVNSYVGRRNMRLLTSINRASYMGIYAMKGKPVDSAQTWLESIKSVDYNQVRNCAEKYFKTDDLIIVIVE